MYHTTLQAPSPLPKLTRYGVLFTAVQLGAKASWTDRIGGVGCRGPAERARVPLTGDLNRSVVWLTAVQLGAYACGAESVVGAWGEGPAEGAQVPPTGSGARARA